jgi:hypothetical protein
MIVGLGNNYSGGLPASLVVYTEEKESDPRYDIFAKFKADYTSDSVKVPSGTTRIPVNGKFYDLTELQATALNLNNQGLMDYAKLLKEHGDELYPNQRDFCDHKYATYIPHNWKELEF